MYAAVLQLFLLIYSHVEMQNYFHQQNMVFNEMKEDAIKYMEYQIDGLLDKIIDYTKCVVSGWENA